MTNSAKKTTKRSAKPAAKSVAPKAKKATTTAAPDAKPKRKKFDADDAKKVLSANMQLRRLRDNPDAARFRSGTHATAKTLPEQYEVFFARLAEFANVSKACAAANLSRDHVYDVRRANKEFAKRWDEAFDLGYDAMEEEAQRRAFEGVDRPIYKNGFLVDVVKETSDTLMMFLLKGRRRRVFGDKQEINVNRGDSPYAKLSDEELDEMIEAQMRGDE